MKILKLILYVVAPIIILEAVLKICGIKPFPHFDEAGMLKFVEERYKGYMCNNDSIGIIPCESAERIIYQGDKIPFKISHLPDGSRYCGDNDSSENICLITGDSNTHGDGVDDKDHIGYKLQALLPGYHIINRSIPGSGNISQLLVLKNSLKQYTPKLVIATYGSYHNARNTFSRSIKKILRIPKSKFEQYTFPKGYLHEGKLGIAYCKYRYQPVPFSDLFSIPESINLLLEKFEYANDKADRVTLAIWKEYVSICKAHHIKLCVIVMTNDERTAEVCNYLKDNSVTIVQVNIPDSMTFKPIDSHPNAAGHNYLTGLIYSKLKVIAL